ncbi:GNAT family N-acetyltransferase [Plastorhodobacter daqingensis]|uniref:GNAT family N-acetyltransferase n=1 Tax=Plastorhodobacter daqingensis TaxID=1387281 RepID=A0ABW2UN71_9RHOB
MLIATDRLLLRPMVADDAGDLRRIVTRPEVGRMLFVFPPDWTLAAAGAFIEATAFHGAPPFRLAITRAGRFIGSIGVGAGDEPSIFYFLDPVEAGQRLGAEAVHGFVDALFRHYPMPALGAEVFQDNPASARLLERIGFRKTGAATHSSAARVEPAAIWLYRLTRKEYKAA